MNAEEAWEASQLARRREERTKEKRHLYLEGLLLEEARRQIKKATRKGLSFVTIYPAARLPTDFLWAREPLFDLPMRCWRTALLPLEEEGFRVRIEDGNFPRAEICWEKKERSK